MTLVLILLSVLILGTAAVAMSLRNLIYSALLLVGTWAGVAAVYLWAGAEFVAFAQVLIYVGAVSMVVLFAVLLTRRSNTDPLVAPESRRRAAAAIAAGGAVAAVLAGAVLSTPFATATRAAPTISVRDLGTQLMTAHPAALLVVGVILTVALIGATILASADAAPATVPRAEPTTVKNDPIALGPEVRR